MQQRSEGDAQNAGRPWTIHCSAHQCPSVGCNGRPPILRELISAHVWLYRKDARNAGRPWRCTTNITRVLFHAGEQTVDSAIAVEESKPQVSGSRPSTASPPQRICAELILRTVNDQGAFLQAGEQLQTSLSAVKEAMPQVPGFGQLTGPAGQLGDVLARAVQYGKRVYSPFAPVSCHVSWPSGRLGNVLARAAQYAIKMLPLRLISCDSVTSAGQQGGCEVCLRKQHSSGSVRSRRFPGGQLRLRHKELGPKQLHSDCKRKQEIFEETG